MKFKAALLGVFALVALSFSQALAGPVAFASDSGGNLYNVDLGTRTTTLIGATGINLLEGLAVSPGGQLYGTDANGILYSINSTTAAPTTIGTTGHGDIEGLSFVGSTLVGADFNAGNLFSINLGTAATTNIVATSPLQDPIRAMTTLDSNDVLLQVGNSLNIMEVNLTTGVATQVVSGGGVLFAAISFLSDGNLYALDINGEAYQLSLITHGATDLGPTTPSETILDMASNSNAVTAAPEPATFALIGAGMLGLAFAPRRRA